MRIQKDKFGGRQREKLFGGRKQDKSGRRRAAGAGLGLTQLSREQAPRQAPMTAAAGRGREGVRRGAKGRGIRSGSGCRGLAPPRAQWPRPGPAPPHLAKPPTAFRCAPGLRASPRQVRPAEPVGNVGGAVLPAAARAGQPDRTRAGARALVPSEGLEILRPGFESGRGHRVTSQHWPPAGVRGQEVVTSDSSALGAEPLSPTHRRGRMNDRIEKQTSHVTSPSLTFSICKVRVPTSAVRCLTDGSSLFHLRPWACTLSAALPPSHLSLNLY